MPAIWLRCAVLVFAALTAACGGTSRVGDELTATSLSQTRKAVALIKLGAADPLCAVLSAGIGVREGRDYRLVKTARIEPSDGVAVAELELGTGEYHIVSYSCVRRGGSLLLAEPGASGGLYKKSYATFALAPGEIVNVGYLHLVPLDSTPTSASYQVLHVRLAVTDWPVSELDRFKQQRPSLYSQMRTRLMTVHKIEPPTPKQIQAQIQARCAEMRRLQAEGKLQNIPTLCTPGAGRWPQQQPASGKRQIGI